MLAQVLPTREGEVRGQLGQADGSAGTKQRDCKVQVRGAAANLGS